MSTTVNRLPKRIALGTATLLAAGSMAMIAAPAAHADDTVLGTLTATPATGADNDGMSFSTSGACNSGADYVQIYVTGEGFTTATNVTPNQAISTLPTTANGGYIFALVDTMRQDAQDAGIAALSGKYDFTMVCRNAFGATHYGDFTGSIWFTTPTTYQSTDPAGSQVTATTTTLAVTPTGSATTGSQVTLTAQVSPTAAGTVQFMDGVNAVGAPVAVVNGTATLTTSALTQGAHSLSAAFTSTDAAFGSSTSTATTYTVSAPGAVNTTTSLAVTPGGSAAPGDPVALTATVTPSDAVGSVTFRDAGNGATLGTVALSGGSASLTVSNLAEGDHSLTASFTPADPAAFAASSATAVPFTVTAPTGGGSGSATGTENINTTVAPGALALSVAGNQVNLPAMALNTTSTQFSTAGPIQTVTVTDTRAGAPGWSLSGQAADFTSGTGTISAQNLGWAPNLVTKDDNVKLALGGNVAPANAVPSTDSGVLGLKSSRTLASATGLGTAQLGADLSLVAPTSTVAGRYTGVLTLTVM
ncbi:Ig-like domain-containing protein [Streptacidiphilus carbonis]|uniref:Ig-like domain-containing protein n=1 Tax=Streptacidiphilus carbonis TaxID=105422 RepID=UPI0006936698|nr:Ig-like domain-containing protein [Streptacidiphilus carbonis]